MINKTDWRRILYVATCLVILVILILAFIVIPNVKMDTSPQATPRAAVHGTLVVIGIHLLITFILAWTIIVDRKGGKIIKGLLIVAGIVLILLSLIITDGATSYLNNSFLHSTAIFMFICVGFDFIAGVLAFAARFLRRRQPLPK